MHDPPQDDTLMRAECARPPAGDQRKWIRDPVRLAARHGHPLLRARTEDVVAITVRPGRLRSGVWGVGPPPSVSKMGGVEVMPGIEPHLRMDGF